MPSSVSSIANSTPTPPTSGIDVSTLKNSISKISKTASNEIQQTYQEVKGFKSKLSSTHFTSQEQNETINSFITQISACIEHIKDPKNKNCPTDFSLRDPKKDKFVLPRNTKESGWNDETNKVYYTHITNYLTKLKDDINNINEKNPTLINAKLESMLNNSGTNSQKARTEIPTLTLGIIKTIINEINKEQSSFNEEESPRNSSQKPHQYANDPNNSYSDSTDYPNNSSSSGSHDSDSIQTSQESMNTDEDQSSHEYGPNETDEQNWSAHNRATIDTTNHSHIAMTDSQTDDDSIRPFRQEASRKKLRPNPPNSSTSSDDKNTHEPKNDKPPSHDYDQNSTDNDDESFSDSKDDPNTNKKHTSDNIDLKTATDGNRSSSSNKHTISTNNHVTPSSNDRAPTSLVSSDAKSAYKEINGDQNSQKNRDGDPLLLDPYSSNEQIIPYTDLNNSQLIYLNEVIQDIEKQQKSLETINNQMQNQQQISIRRQQFSTDIPNSLKLKKEIHDNILAIRLHELQELKQSYPRNKQITNTLNALKPELNKLQLNQDHVKLQLLKSIKSYGQYKLSEINNSDHNQEEKIQQYKDLLNNIETYLEISKLKNNLQASHHPDNVDQLHCDISKLQKEIKSKIENLKQKQEKLAVSVFDNLEIVSQKTALKKSGPLPLFDPNIADSRTPIDV